MTSAALHIALLRETRESSLCQIQEVVASSRACRSLVEESLLELHAANAVSLSGEEIHINPEQRLRIAEVAVAIGADFERVTRELRWQEFEAFADWVLTEDGFATLNHFVFKGSGRRFEIDVVGTKEPMVLCIDCKHWHHGRVPSKVSASARDQLQRVRFLSGVFTAHGVRLDTAGWRSARVLPVILTLGDASPKLIEGVPIVSVLRLKSFLSEINPWLDELRFVDVSIC
mgnify:CR=1 FL=1